MLSGLRSTTRPDGPMGKSDRAFAGALGRLGNGHARVLLGDAGNPLRSAGVVNRVRRGAAAAASRRIDGDRACRSRCSPPTPVIARRPDTFATRRRRAVSPVGGDRAGAVRSYSSIVDTSTWADGPPARQLDLPDFDFAGCAGTAARRARAGCQASGHRCATCRRSCAPSASITASRRVDRRRRAERRRGRRAAHATRRRSAAWPPAFKVKLYARSPGVALMRALAATSSSRATSRALLTRDADGPHRTTPTRSSRARSRSTSCWAAADSTGSSRTRKRSPSRRSFDVGPRLGRPRRPAARLFRPARLRDEGEARAARPPRHARRARPGVRRSRADIRRIRTVR